MMWTIIMLEEVISTRMETFHQGMIMMMVIQNNFRHWRQVTKNQKKQSLIYFVFCLV